MRDGALGVPLARACAAMVDELEARDVLTPAGIGRDRHHDPALRGDHTAWLSDTDPRPAALGLRAFFDDWLHRLNEGLWLGLRRYAVQLARYPGDGARYVRHTDALAGDPNRVLTVIVYLNPHWTPADGGCLTAWTPDGPIDVEPRLDRMVLFRSDAVPHAVAPTWAPRRAATAWYRATETVPLLADRG